MNDAAKLALLKVMLGDQNGDTDETLAAYLDLAGKAIMLTAYPYGTEKMLVPNRYAHLQCEIAVEQLNKRGAEGETSHSENGISRGYQAADVSHDLLSKIVPNAGFPS